MHHCLEPNTLSTTTTSTSLKSYGGWGFIECQNIDSYNPIVYCLSVNNSMTQYGTEVIIDVVKAGSKNQIWSMTSDGHIQSRLYGNLVLDIGVQLSNGSYSLITNNFKIGAASQQWVIKENGQISNELYPNFSIGFNGTSPNSGSQVIVGPPPVNPVNYQWWTNPTYSLSKIVSSPPVAFPAYTTGDYLASYQFLSLLATINQTNDIRSQYVNANANLTSYQSYVSNATCPSSIPSQDIFNQVKTQINTELTYALTVRLVFSNYKTFYNQLFGKSSVDLAALAKLCNADMSSNATVNGNYLNAMYSVFYAIVSEIPLCGSTIANIGQSALEISEAGGGGGGPSTYQVELVNLDAHLSSNFSKELTNAMNMQDSILKDWGMMESTYNLCYEPVWNPSSLNVTGLQFEQLLNVASNAYDISILQMLMPTQWQMYYSPAASKMLPPNLQPSFSYKSGSNTIFLASASNSSSYPPSALTSKIWNSNVAQNEFYLSTFGWNFPTAMYFYVQQGNYDNVYKIACPTVSNLTTTPMNFSVTSDGDLLGIWQAYTNSTGFVPTYYHVGMLGHHYLDIAVTDLNGSKVASFTVHIDLLALQGSNVWIEPNSTTTSSGYTVGAPTCNQGSYSQTFSASILIPIYSTSTQ